MSLYRVLMCILNSNNILTLCSKNAFFIPAFEIMGFRNMKNLLKSWKMTLQRTILGKKKTVKYECLWFHLQFKLSIIARETVCL